MVSRRAFFFSVALLLAGQAHAAPFFVKTTGLTARSAAPISTFERGIPSEIAVRAPDGIIVPFSKREEEELLRRQANSTSSGNVTVTVDNSPPASVPPDNLNKLNPQDVPEEAAVQAPGGVVEPYTKREGRLFGRQDNSTSSGNSTSSSGNTTTVTVDNSPPVSAPSGNLNKLNPQNLPEEAAVQAPGGVVEPYTKREGSLFGRQDNSTSPSCNTTVTVDNSPPPPVPEGNNDSLNPQNINDNEPTSAIDGVVTTYGKRRNARKFISSEIPTRSLNGEIELY